MQMKEQHEANESEKASTAPQTHETTDLQEATEELEEELKLEHMKADDYLRRLQYLQAEFDNYRRRVEREREEMNRAAVDKLLADMISVVDELEMAIQVAKKSDEREIVVAGLEMVLKKLNSMLQRGGLTPVEAVGKEFDPNLHEAIQSVESDDEQIGRVVEEVRKGFTLRGKVIRSSLVKVGVASKEVKIE